MQNPLSFVSVLFNSSQSHEKWIFYNGKVNFTLRMKTINQGLNS